MLTRSLSLIESPPSSPPYERGTGPTSVGSPSEPPHRVVTSERPGPTTKGGQADNPLAPACASLLPSGACAAIALGS